MEEGTSGSRRTRSQVAPDWSLKDCLTLVNEIAGVESDCLNDLSSFQKWTMISESCNALGVRRTLNQCRRKWDSLVSDYNQIKLWKSRGTEKTKELNLPKNIDNELFEAIHAVVLIQEDKAGTEPDSDPEDEEGSDVLDVTAELAFTGSKRSRQRTMVTKENSPQRTKREEDPRPDRVQKKPSKATQQKTTMEEKKQLVEEISMDEEEEEVEAVEAKLSYKIDLIHAIVGRTPAKDDDISIEDKLKFVRQQGDELISCLSEIVNTFSKLRKVHSE